MPAENENRVVDSVTPMGEAPLHSPHWTDLLSERWTKKMKLATIYSDHYSGAGAVGHDDLLLIAWMTEVLNRTTERYAVDIPALYQPRAE